MTKQAESALTEPLNIAEEIARIDQQNRLSRLPPPAVWPYALGGLIAGAAMMGVVAILMRYSNGIGGTMAPDEIGQGIRWDIWLENVSRLAMG